MYINFIFFNIAFKEKFVNCITKIIKRIHSA
jgi:hypothetical protein